MTRDLMLVGALIAVGCSGRSTNGSESDGPASAGSTAASGGTSSGGTPSTGGVVTGGTGQSGTHDHGGTTSGCGNDFPTNCDVVLSGPCSSEGATCHGQRWDDDSGCNRWSLLCCNGQWQSYDPAFEPVCPDPLMPGDRFTCSTDRGVTCVAGESHCRYENEQPSNEKMTSCKPLCDAGDCSCFCTPDDMGYCNFVPEDAATASDSGCTCAWTLSTIGPRQLGGVEVYCTYRRQ